MGYLAGVFDKPGDNGAAVKAGTLAGVIGGIGAMFGQVIGGVLNSVLVSPEGYAQTLQQFGVEGMNETAYWVGRVGGVCCAGIFDILLMAGLGALGGLLWWQFSGKNSARASVMNM
jgi:hypothetical protein